VAVDDLPSVGVAPIDVGDPQALHRSRPSLGKRGAGLVLHQLAEVVAERSSDGCRRPRVVTKVLKSVAKTLGRVDCGGVSSAGAAVAAVHVA
jgi:hypothetical protein